MNASPELGRRALDQLVPINKTGSAGDNNPVEGPIHFYRALEENRWPKPNQ